MFNKDIFQSFKKCFLKEIGILQQFLMEKIGLKSQNQIIVS